MNIEELIENFASLDDTDDKYAYIIELGKNLTPMPENLKIEANKVYGCTSQVWLAYDINKKGFINYIADSDAAIVKGLIAILLLAYSGKKSGDILNFDAKKLFIDLGLEHHLSPNRRNGFVAMVDKIKDIAKLN